MLHSIKKTVFTDANGYYSASFARGHEINIASKANGFIAKRRYCGELQNNTIEINLELDRLKKNPKLVKYSIENSIEFDTTDKAPFLRIRIHSAKGSKLLDLKNIKTFGFDFHSQKMTSDTLNCDIWYKVINKAQQPTVIVANRTGGIIPVYSSEIESSFAYEKIIAPTRGYVYECKLKGNEEGFFVRCRDGKSYGKIIFEKSEIDSGRSDDKGGWYKDLGKYFSYLYQPNGTTDLSFSTPEIDLEDFLVSKRLN